MSSVPSSLPSDALRSQPAPLSSSPTLALVSPPDADVLARRERLVLDELFKLSQPPGYYSETAKTALLRRGRRRPHDQLLVEFAEPEILTELTAADRLLWSSLWTWQATVDGQPLAALNRWNEICWHTDADVDYLELELHLTGGWQLQRQMLLARKDRFLLLADALTGPTGYAAVGMGNGAPAATIAPAPAPHDIRFASTIPLAAGIQLAPAQETREAWLTAGRKRVATLIPIALPEWRAELSPAELSGTSDGKLVLTTAARGRNLYSPLWIDLDGTQTKQPLTWRRLTVAEDLEVVRRDVAVGFRVQIGQKQWLVYRSLDPRGNRTVLGRNYSTEFVCCRFLKTGATADILEIQ